MIRDLGCKLVNVVAMVEKREKALRSAFGDATLEVVGRLA